MKKSLTILALVLFVGVGVNPAFAVDPKGKAKTECSKADTTKCSKKAEACTKKEAKACSNATAEKPACCKKAAAAQTAAK